MTACNAPYPRSEIIDFECRGSLENGHAAAARVNSSAQVEIAIHIRFPSHLQFFAGVVVPIPTLPEL